MKSYNSMKPNSKSNSPWSNSARPNSTARFSPPKPRPGRMVDLPDECLFFIDDSNIWIEAQKFAAKANEHMPKLTDSDHDPRLRIDIGRLVTTLLRNENNKHRIQGKSFYYGSKPPPTDSVWKAAQKFNFEPKIYDKAASGREKEVDGSMGADISGISSDLSARADMEAQMEAQYGIDIFDHRDRINRTTFICITGDRDMMPAILKALNSGICVELWAWKDSMSKEFVKLETTMAHTSSLFSVHYLDGVFSEIFFTNYFSTRLGAKSVDPAKAVVLCDFVPAWYERYMFQSPEAGPTSGSKSSASLTSLPPKDVHKASPLEKAVCNKLILLGKVFYITRDTPAATSGVPPPPTLFIEFPRVEDRLIEKLLLRIRDSFRGIATVLSWPVYAGKTSRKTMPTTETSNMYAPLSGDDAHVHEEEDDTEALEEKGKDIDKVHIETLHIDDVAGVGGDAIVSANVIVNASHGLPSPAPSLSPSPSGQGGQGEADGSSEDASAGWQTVTHFDRGAAHRRSRNRTQHCPFGLHCYKRGQCGNIHSHTDLLLFQEHPLQNFKRWKTEPCRYGDACANGRRCTYAHSVAEAQCLTCKGTGHYASGCKH